MKGTNSESALTVSKQGGKMQRNKMHKKQLLDSYLTHSVKNSSFDQIKLKPLLHTDKAPSFCGSHKKQRNIKK